MVKTGTLKKLVETGKMQKVVDEALSEVLADRFCPSARSASEQQRSRDRLRGLTVAEGK